MLKIGLDIMGGDAAPEATVKGAIAALREIEENSTIVLFGPEDIIVELLKKQGSSPEFFEIIHAPEVILMKEHPVNALQKKPVNSISVAYKYLKEKDIDVFASAGNSGAMMIASLNSIGLLEGVSRPCVSSTYPIQNGNSNTLLDVGINADCKPETLLQFAVLGSIYVSEILEVENPRVALLNTGEEETKGSLLYQKAYQLLKSSEAINFVGNIEARDFFDGKAEVTVCDGFTGNIFLKQSEGFFKILKKNNIKNSYLDQFNFEEYGGTPVLGVNGNVVLGHGISGQEAIKNMILTSEEIAQKRLSEVLSEKFNTVKWH